MVEWVSVVCACECACACACPTTYFGQDVPCLQCLQFLCSGWLSLVWKARRSFGLGARADDPPHMRMPPPPVGPRCELPPRARRPAAWNTQAPPTLPGSAPWGRGGGDQQGQPLVARGTEEGRLCQQCDGPSTHIMLMGYGLGCWSGGLVWLCWGPVNRV